MTTPADCARASVRVDLPIEEAFRIFTEEIDRWWRRGRAFRAAGARRGIIALEPGVGGRLYESFETKRGREKIIETGRVTHWEPPHRIAFEWRNVNFRADEATWVEVRFEPGSRGTLVTITHSGWDAIRPDHPARHGMDPAPFLASLGRWWGQLLSSLRLQALDRG